MSAQLSPDGMFYWDGRQWMSTLSSDGRSRWNGTAWVPAGQGYGAASAYPWPGPAARAPTSWTRPLQLTVAGFYVLQGAYALSLPFWMSGTVTQVFNQSLQRQQELNPNAIPPPPEFMNAMTSFMGVALWVAAAFSLAIAVVVVIGALKRWTWIYYVILVLLGFGAISLPVDLIDALGGPAVSSASGFGLPSWTYWLGLAAAIPSTALFIWMLVALVKRGPWGMRRVTPPLG